MAVRRLRPLLVTFDAFGTLFAPKAPIEQQYHEVARQFGLNVDAQSIKSSFKTAFREVSGQYPNYGYKYGLTPQIWWSQVIEKTFAPLLKPESQVPDELVSDLYQRFSTSRGYQMFDDVERFVKRLSQARTEDSHLPAAIMLGIISNSDKRIVNVLESFGIRFAPHVYSYGQKESASVGTFSFVALSSEIGVEKPSSDIFRYALTEAQKTLTLLKSQKSYDELPADIHDFRRLHVGDDLENDALAAHRAGWDSILLDRDGKFVDKSQRGEQSEITAVRDLSQIDLSTPL